MRYGTIYDNTLSVIINFKSKLIRGNIDVEIFPIVTAAHHFIFIYWDNREAKIG